MFMNLIYVCVPHACLVPTEIRKDSVELELWMVMDAKS